MYCEAKVSARVRVVSKTAPARRRQQSITHPASERGDGTVGVHQRVVLVDTLEVLHDTCTSSSVLGLVRPAPPFGDGIDSTHRKESSA